MTDSWSLPTTSNYKVNVDGAIFSQIEGSRVGVVIRDHDGRVAAAMSMKLLQPLGLPEIEVKAMEIGVAFAWDVGIRDVVVESDSKIVADTLLGSYTPPMVVFNVLVGVAHKFQDFRSIQISHVKRQGNKPTHLLEKFAKEIDNIDNNITRIEDNPSPIKLAIAHDELNLSFS